MFRIAALNEESGDETGSEDEVTREALEEIALQQYAKSLELQKKGNYEQALTFLKELLNTEIMHEVQKPEVQDNIARPLLNMKYLCYRNLATISERLKKNEEAVEAYCEAVSIDHTDITIWYKLGRLSLECEKFNLALYAFQRGVQVNSAHWPCLDSLITIYLGLGDYNNCILTIYDALQLDIDYLRGRAYRKYIFSNYDYVMEYLSALDPKYAWNPQEDADFDDEKGDILIAQAMEINKKYIEQVALNAFTTVLPILSLQKPIASLTWESVGSSLVHMHKYMSEKMLSHACVIEISINDVSTEDILSPQENKMDVDEVPNDIGCPLDISPDESSKADVTDTEQSEKEKVDNEKIDGETEQLQAKDEKDDSEANKNSNDPKDKKVVRRRNSLNLGLWEWCKTKDKSSKKKPVKQIRDETVYDSLRKFLPDNLISNENRNCSWELETEHSMNTEDFNKLFEDQDNSNLNTVSNKNDQYFGCEKERKEVENFVNKFISSPVDIITMLNEFLEILANKWNILWPKKLGNYFVEAVGCQNQHIDAPSIHEEYFEEIKLFTYIKLCAAEISLHELIINCEHSDPFDTSFLNDLSVYVTRMDIFGDDYLNVILRYSWIQAHAFIFNNITEFALEYLYRMVNELNEMVQQDNNFKIVVPNFPSNVCIRRSTVVDVIKSLERNEYLSTVMSLYDKGMLEEVKSILLQSFKSCQALAHKGEYSAMSLDWATQLILLLDTLWGLGDKEECFYWATKCFHESLKHYFKCTSGKDNSRKWSLSVLKSLVTMEFLIRTEGSYFILNLQQNKLVNLVNNLTKVICHQTEESQTMEMPVDTVAPWVLLHYIIQIEEDQGRIKKAIIANDDTDNAKELIPNSFLILFIAHEYLGKRSWCCNNEGQLLYFILDTIIPRIKSPALTPILETLSQYLEQCVFCLFGHPSKKSKSRYFVDHNVTPFKLDWSRAQQIFELYNPLELPEFDSIRLASISLDTEQLFQRMLALLPPELEIKPHVDNVTGYIEGKRDFIKESDIPLPFKMRNIYYLLADYYLKTNDSLRALKYFVFDIVINKDRFNSWAGMALARASLLDTKLNSCENFKSDMEYYHKASAAERCFQRALEIDSSHPMLWIEYGNFVYSVHSFCSRTLKQASESLSMDDFEQLEKRKENMLDTAEKCFMNANHEFATEFDCDKDIQDERWLHHYMLGKVAEKKGKSPEEYLSHYMKAAHFLKLNNAEYPLKINYNNPQNLSVEALEIHYRINASILKYIEQHENKVIFDSEGKVFLEYVNKCMRKTSNAIASENRGTLKNPLDKDSLSIGGRDSKNLTDNNQSESKRPLTDKENGQENKKIKMDVDFIEKKYTDPGVPEKTVCDQVETSILENINPAVISKDFNTEFISDANKYSKTIEKEPDQITTIKEIDSERNEIEDQNKSHNRRPSHESITTSRDNSSSNTSTDSSSESSSESSSSSSDSTSSKGSQSKPVDEPLSQEQIDIIIGLCLENLEDCVSRFNQHYKALYRLAHYHFYFKRGKNVARCRDLMLGSFVGRRGSKLQGLFCERKNSNFFNAIWRIPVSEVDRPGSFAFHMGRCVLLLMEILKEIDDHKTLLDLSLQLQRIPDMDKKYLRDFEREELSQQAFSLCVQSLKGQLTKFCHQSDLLSNPVEKRALSSLILDIYRAYQKAQKFASSKTSQFSNLLMEGYKLITSSNISDTTNLLEATLKYCQSMITNMKQQATSNAITSQNSTLTSQFKRSLSKPETSKVTTIPASTFLPNADFRSTYNKTSINQSALKPSFSNYFPSMVDPSMLSILSNPSTAAATLSYMSNIAGFSNLSGMRTSYQTELLRQVMTSSLGSPTYIPPLGAAFQGNISKPKPPSVGRGVQKTKPDYTNKMTIGSTSIVPHVPKSMSHKAKSIPSYSSTAPYNASRKVTKESQINTSPLLSTVLPPTLPQSLMNPANNQIKPNYVGSIPSHLPTSQGMFPLPSQMAKPAHISATSTTNAVLHAKPPSPHQQVSPGKTLQEKLAEKQKFNPALPKTSNMNLAMQEIASSFSGKIPSALTITKTSGSVSLQNTSDDIKKVQNKSKDEKSSSDVRRSIQFDDISNNKTSEIIVLDDD